MRSLVRGSLRGYKANSTEGSKGDWLPLGYVGDKSHNHEISVWSDERHRRLPQ
jgi:hypothetical protein